MVAITWSLTNGGAAITELIDQGNFSNGQTGSSTTLYLRHDGANSITGCKLYIRAYSGTYSGDASAALDIAELLAWGDAAAETDFGGFQINMGATDSFPADWWPTLSTKTGAQGYVCRTGTADSASTGVLLTTNTGCTAEGEIQVGGSPNVRFACRIRTPDSEDTIGIRQFDQVLVYTYTS